MTKCEERKPKVLTVDDLINHLEDLAAHHGCGNWEVRISVGGVEQNAFGVWRSKSHVERGLKYIRIE